jgi:hypothetical protein
LVLRDTDDKVIAAGDLFQTANGSRVNSELIFNFKDGSLYRERVVYLQRRTFQLLTYHLTAKGKSFKHDTEMSIDAASGQTKVVETGDDGKEKTYDEHLKLPADLANGMVTTLLLDVDPKALQTTLSMVVATPKPRLVKLEITPGAEDSFVAGGVSRRGVSFNIKIDLGGVVGVVAPLVGKQPPDIHVWVLPGRAPGFLKSEGPLYAGGPIWKIELDRPDWPQKR